MPQFKNLQELQAHLQKTRGGAVLSNGQTVQQLLASEIQRLKEIIEKYINQYLDSYAPVRYERTGAWLDSIEVTTPHQISNNTWAVELGFNPNKAYHKSYIGENQPDGYVPWLMDVGWNISSNVQPRIYRFTHWEGSQYLSKAVAEWNLGKPTGFQIKVFHNGEEVMF